MSDLHELGKRAVACKHWRWMPGMLITPADERAALFPGRIVAVDAYNARLVWETGTGHVVGQTWLTENFVPDLSDPATLGCLLTLGRGIRRNLAAALVNYTGYCPRCEDDE